MRKTIEEVSAAMLKLKVQLALPPKTQYGLSRVGPLEAGKVPVEELGYHCIRIYLNSSETLPPGTEIPEMFEGIRVFVRQPDRSFTFGSH